VLFRSLISGVAAYIKAVRPEVQVIGVQTADSDAMTRSLAAGQRVLLQDVGLFSDGTAVRQVGEETFRLAHQVVDAMITVDTDALCAAIKDVFQDTRSILEPAGALAIAGLKAWTTREKVRGKTLVEAGQDIRLELERARRQLDVAAARLVEEGLAVWGGGEGRDRALIVRGRANLLGDRETLEDLERVRMLFDDLEQKEQLISLLDGVREAQGVRIFIGAETRLFSLSGSAVIAAPYMSGQKKLLGAIGVIGPTRLNYARVIPLVDYTARVLSQMAGV
jgi:transcriptional regulator of heat shock response